MSEDKGRELTWIWFKFIPKAICHCEWNRNLKVSLYCTAEGVKRLAYKISRLHCPGLDTIDTRYSVSSYRYRFMGQVSGQEEDSNKCVNASEIYQCCWPQRRISPGWLLLKSSTCAAVGTWRGVGEYVHCGTYSWRRTFANALTSWPGKCLFSIVF